MPDVSWPLRGNRDFVIFFCTQGISNIGDAASGLLIPLFVLQLTHNPLQVSAVAALEIATFIGLRIPFGALSDRHERRRLMLGADLARTALTLAIPVTSALHGPALPVVYAVIVPISAAAALFDSGAGGAVPLLVPEQSRGAAYGLTEGAESVAWVIGPPVGGLLALLVGTGQAIGLDAASFLVSVAGLLAIRSRFEPAAQEAGPGAPARPRPVRVRRSGRRPARPRRLGRPGPETRGTARSGAVGRRAATRRSRTRSGRRAAPRVATFS
jgi:MFS family permease